ESVVEDCVNAVGVDLNTASVPLLSRVSGLSASVAKSVVRWREANGAFRNRQQLMAVSGLGARTFELSAGFLRIRGGDNPLDMTGDIVRVRVVEVDAARKRIALSMKLGEAPARRDAPKDNRFEGAGRGQRQQPATPVDTAMAGAFAKLRGLGK